MDDLLRPSRLDVVLDPIELVTDLVEDRKAVVVEVVEHFVEEPSGALGEQALPEALVVLAPPEEPRHRVELDVRHRHQVVRAEEEVELGRVQTLDRLVVRGKVEDAEQVALVDIVVDLRALPLRQDVLDVERVPAEARAEIVDRLRIERLEVDPGEAFGAELSDAWFRARRDRLREAARPRPPDAGQAWHRY